MPRALRFGLYALVFLAVLGASAYLTTRLIIKSEPEVLVPDLTGQEAIAALKTLSDLGLNLKVQGLEYSDQVPPDHVAAQDPLPGTRIKKDRDVKVVLSKGPLQVRLPDLRGLSLSQARSILAQSDLGVGRLSRTYAPGPDQAPDRILAQVPEPRTRLARGSEVDLLLSLGPRPVYLVMPALTGRPYRLALVSLEQAGLVLGPLETVSRRNWPPGAVIAQDPAPGGRVAKGTQVRLTVNQKEPGDLAPYRFHLLEYQVSHGLLPRQVRIRVALGPDYFDLYEAWHPPGERLILVALVSGPLRAQVFEDGEEMSLLGRPLGTAR